MLALALATGVTAALAARAELRVSPRPALMSYGFASYLCFLCLLLLPISFYFFMFHGDWFVLYAVDTHQLPSAMVMLGFFVEAGLGVGGFLIGATVVRNELETWGGALVILVLLVAGIVVVIGRDRLSVVGSYAQYHAGYALQPYGSGALWYGTLVMGLLLFAGLAYLLVRLYLGMRRLR